VFRKTVELSNLAQLLRSRPNQPDLATHQTNVFWRTDPIFLVDGSRITFIYDAVSNRAIMAEGTGRHTSTYHALDRTKTVVNPSNKKIKNAYDAVGVG
jgi:hypothetical protein